MSSKQPMTTQLVDVQLKELLKILRLPTVAQHYHAHARQAEEKGDSYAQYLLGLLQEEHAQREINRRQRLLRQAKFPITYTLDTFEFNAVPSLSKQKVMELARGEFIRKAENLVLVGQIGTGKTHLASALGYAACEAGYKVRFFTASSLINQLIEAQEAQRLTRLERTLAKQDLIIIDELGFVPFSHLGAQMLFTFISQRYRLGSLLITTNLPFSEWTQIFQEPRLLGALLDRLTHTCHILEFSAESYRFRQSQARLANADSLDTDAHT